MTLKKSIIELYYRIKLKCVSKKLTTIVSFISGFSSKISASSSLNFKSKLNDLSIKNIIAKRPQVLEVAV